MVYAKDIMTGDIITIYPDATVGQAISILLDKRISGLPVVDSEGNLTGIITEFALLAAAYDGKVSQDAVSKHMTKQVMTVDEEATVKSIADLCILHRIRRLPVVRDGKLVGQISRRDVLRAVHEQTQAEMESTAS